MRSRVACFYSVLFPCALTLTACGAKVAITFSNEGGAGGQTATGGEGGATTTTTSTTDSWTTTPTTTTTSTTDTTSTTTTTTTTTSTTSTTTTTTTTTTGTVDCANIPKGPFPFTVKTGQKATEDMDFDDQGNLVGAENGNIFRSTFDGQSTIWVPGGGSFIAGLRFNSNGVLVYADVNANALYRIEPPANKSFVIGGLSYPNGMDADNDGNITVAEQSASQLRRVNPMTGESEILAMNLNNPNGVSYSPDFKTIYVGSFGGNIIYKIGLDADNKPVSQGVLIQGAFTNGTLDGMGVDACGNVYVCEYIAAKVWRISPDGLNKELVADLSSQTGWIPNMGWGSGIGGWDPLMLYVRDIQSSKMYAIPVGVPAKPRKYP
ncbi:MAG: SMP-30/gluconolactonase/LRE family protein [Polyangiaceae bacterium]